ncbi:hypothetical protein MILUP08_43529 [Micromonospora lupini str. Lupac 08]|uniref:Uncharacterized protein n=1 Tax=Micromonospora lupini str. Lupac 08 TaxID=1150864 RepID=I0L471_9ACTN|nr:hypothetical protein MILUP08_43529 [Micromonospora lupini str. Lupac 08]
MRLGAADNYCPSGFRVVCRVVGSGVLSRQSACQDDYLDPWSVLRFRSWMEERRGRRAAAIA